MSDKILAGQLNLENSERPADMLRRKASQLYSMLVTATGDGYPSFERYNDTIKENYLWACSDLARQIEVLSEHVMDLPVLKATA